MIFQNENFDRRAQMKAPTMAPNRPPHWLIPPSVSEKTRKTWPPAKRRKFSHT